MKHSKNNSFVIVKTNINIFLFECKLKEFQKRASYNYIIIFLNDFKCDFKYYYTYL